MTLAARWTLLGVLAGVPCVLGVIEPPLWATVAVGALSGALGLWLTARARRVHRAAHAVVKGETPDPIGDVVLDRLLDRRAEPAEGSQQVLAALSGWADGDFSRDAIDVPEPFRDPVETVRGHVVERVHAVTALGGEILERARELGGSIDRLERDLRDGALGMDQAVRGLEDDEARFSEGLQEASQAASELQEQLAHARWHDARTKEGRARAARALSAQRWSPLDGELNRVTTAFHRTFGALERDPSPDEQMTWIGRGRGHVEALEGLRAEIARMLVEARTQLVAPEPALGEGTGRAVTTGLERARLGLLGASRALAEGKGTLNRASEGICKMGGVVESCERLARQLELALGHASTGMEFEQKLSELLDNGQKGRTIASKDLQEAAERLEAEFDRARVRLDRWVELIERGEGDTVQQDRP